MDRREAIRRTSLIVGGALSASAIAAVMSGCKSAPVDPNWTAGYLDENQISTVAEVVERIIPTTDTPGAKEAGVHQFIDAFLQDNATKEEQSMLKAGLADLDSRSRNKHSKIFAKLSDDQMDDILTEIAQGSHASEEDIASAIANEGEAVQGLQLDPKMFFSSIRQLTLLGFFTSEIGATQVLKMDAIPGHYLGCIPYEEVGRAWAL